MPLSASPVLVLGRGYTQMSVICPLGTATESMLGPSLEGRKIKIWFVLSPQISWLCLKCPWEIRSHMKLEAASHWREVPWQAPFAILPYHPQVTDQQNTAWKGMRLFKEKNKDQSLLLIWCCNYPLPTKSIRWEHCSPWTKTHQDKDSWVEFVFSRPPLIQLPIGRLRVLRMRCRMRFTVGPAPTPSPLTKGTGCVCLSKSIIELAASLKRVT